MILDKTKISFARNLVGEMGAHAPYTGFGTVTAIVIVASMLHFHVSTSASETLFWVLHPLHVLVSAWATTALYRLHDNQSRVRLFLVGYLGSVGIATLSDSLIPYVGEALLDLPNRGLHFGAIEKWWLVNPLAVAGMLIGSYYPISKLPHTIHVLLSTWASLFHVMMAKPNLFGTTTLALVAVFLFLAVWIPCCTSDIVFPLLLRSRQQSDKI